MAVNLQANVTTEIPDKPEFNKESSVYKQDTYQVDPVASRQSNQVVKSTFKQAVKTSNMGEGVCQVLNSPVSNTGDHHPVLPQSQPSANGTSESSMARHQGTVEKLLPNYGFIDPINKQPGSGQLFFHMSEYVPGGELQVGDQVEYSVSYDFRSKRWLAVAVVKIQLPCKIHTEQYKGEIMTEAPVKSSIKNNSDRGGSIAYELNGETFYVPYSHVDLLDQERPCKHRDQVQFYLASDQINGFLWATRVTKLEPPRRHQGVVCSLKENFGFIERADIVKEIFFHYSEYKGGNIAEVTLGDDVEYNIQMRQGREVATNIYKLPEGTVTFEEVLDEIQEGRVEKVIKVSQGRQADPLAGVIYYRSEAGEETMINYSERDVAGEFSMFCNDLVNFQVAVDKRDSVRHATNVTLSEKTYSREQRSVGVVSSVKESYGFLQVHDPIYTKKYGEAQLFFHFNEIVRRDASPPVVVGDELEFTVATDPNSQQKPIAIRVKKLPKGSIKGNTIVAQHFNGTVTHDPGKNKTTGQIKYISDKKNHTVQYLTKDADLRYGDSVSFNIQETLDDRGHLVDRKAVNIKLIKRLGMQSGFIVSMKDKYGFIETLACDDEIFFHNSCLVMEKPEIGDYVIYTLASRQTSKNGELKKISAEDVKKAPLEMIMTIEGKFHKGRVARSIRSHNSTDREYCGVIEVVNEPGKTYPFGVMSLVLKRSLPPTDTVVEFQVAHMKGQRERAVNVFSVDQIQYGKIVDLRAAVGYIEQEKQESYTNTRRPSFGLDCWTGPAPPQIGDRVKFVIGQKHWAYCVRKVADQNGHTRQAEKEMRCSRPEHLKNYKSHRTEVEGPKLIITREPRRPDQGKGFGARIVKPIFQELASKCGETCA